MIEFQEGSTNMEKVVLLMRAYMGRWPLESEVYNFIMGDEKQRKAILNNAG